MAVPKLAQVSRMAADFTRVEITASGGQGTSVSNGSDPLLDSICPDILLSCHEYAPSLLPRISVSFSHTSAILEEGRSW